MGELTSRPRRRQERNIAQLIDTFLPLPAGFLRWIDVLDTLAVDELDGVADPAALDFDAGGAIGEDYCVLALVLKYGRER